MSEPLLHHTRWSELDGEFEARKHLEAAADALQKIEGDASISSHAATAHSFVLRALSSLHPVVQSAQGQREYADKCLERAARKKKPEPEKKPT